MSISLFDSTNSSMKTFTCGYPNCNKIFSSKFSLKRHQGIHCNTKSFICNYCGKKFAIAQYLKEHSYCHTKDKFYVCAINGCQKAFRHASDVSLHRRTHPEFKVRKYRYLQQNSVSCQNPDNNSKPKVLRVKKNKSYVKEEDVKQAETNDNPANSLTKSSPDLMVKNLKEEDTELDINYMRYLTDMCNEMKVLERLELPQPKLPKAMI